MGVKPRHQPEQHRLDDGSTREHARGEDACGNQQEYQNPEHRHAFASFHDTPPTSKPSSSGFDQHAGTAAVRHAQEAQSSLLCPSSLVGE